MFHIRVICCIAKKIKIKTNKIENKKKLLGKNYEAINLLLSSGL